MKSENNFFKEIEDNLHAHEDAYVPGAWEDFQQKRKRRRMAVLFFRLGSAAAVLLLFGFGAVQFFTKAPVPVQTVKTKNKQHQLPVNPLKPDRVSSANDSLIATENARHLSIQRDTASPVQALVKHNTGQPMQTFAKPAPVSQSTVYKDNTLLIADNKTVKPNDVVKQPEKLLAASDTARPAKAATTGLQNNVLANNENAKRTADDKPVYDMLVKSKTNQDLPHIQTKIKRVSYAVMISPAVGNQKVNFGTGVQVFYHFNNKLSISSGLAYSSLNATASGDPGTDPLKKLQGVDLALSGFEVPIALQYKTSNGFYVSAGVLGMSVLNNRLDYSYLTANTVAAAAANPAGSTMQYLSVVAQPKTEESKEKVNNYMGFYILSLGKKKAVGHNQVNFGPFLRVPFGAVTSEKINLMQGGVHLGFEF